MDEKLYKILNKIYKNENAGWDSETSTNSFHIPSNLNLQDAKYLREKNIELNLKQHFSHDDVVKRLMNVVNDVRISPERIAKSFIAGVGGSYPRGLQPIISYYYAKHLTEHEIVDSDGAAICVHCGIEIAKWKNVSFEIFNNYSGYAWNEIPLRYLIDLEEFVGQPEIEPTSLDIEIFNKLLKTISTSAEDETPGQLEKRLAQEKIIPKVDKYRRYGILIALAEVGVLPNTIQAPTIDRFITREELWGNSKKLKANLRADIVLPFGAWRGSLGVDYARAKQVFGEFVITK